MDNHFKPQDDDISIRHESLKRILFQTGLLFSIAFGVPWMITALVLLRGESFNRADLATLPFLGISLCIFVSSYLYHCG